MCKVCVICAKSMKLGALTNYNKQIILSLDPIQICPRGASIATEPVAMATNPPHSNSK